MAAALTPDTFDGFLSEHSVVLAEFYRDGCVPCRRLSPLLSEAEKTYEGRAAVAKISLNTGLPLAERLEVQSAPTLILFKNGEEISRHSGFMDRDALKDLIETAL